MFEQYTAEDLETRYDIPKEVLPLILQTPRLLPGETQDELTGLFEVLMYEVDPQSAIEWLTTIDLTFILWEIHRYRRWKNAIICTGHAESLKAALHKTNSATLVEGSEAAVRVEAQLDAEKWRTNPASRQLIEQRLQQHGYDADAISAGAFVEGLPSLVLIEKFLTSARHQFNSLLREVAVRREFTQRARKIFREQCEADELRKEETKVFEPQER